jgi:hypothetical protein
METNQRINSIMQALQMRDELWDGTTAGIRTTAPTVSGEDRKSLVAQLVKLLLIEETTVA